MSEQYIDPRATMPIDASVNSILSGRRWWIVLLLFIAGFINYLDRTVVSVALPIIASDLHLGPARMGILLSAFFWSYALMQIPIGWLADRYDIRWLYAICFTLWSLSCGFTGFVGSLGLFLFVRVLLGIGESIYLPGGIKIVSLLFSATARGLASGLVNCGTRAGLAFGAPLIAALVVAFGWKRCFFILGFGSLLWLIPWLLAFPRRIGRAVPNDSRGSGSNLRVVDRKLLGISLANIGYGYYFYLLVTWLPTYLVQERHLTLKQAGAYALIPYLTFALGEPVGGWLADKLVVLGWEEGFSRKIVITASHFSSIFLIFSAVVSDTPSVIALLAGASLVGLSTGNIYALVQRVSPSNQVGLSLGVFNLAGNLSGVIAPVATGLLIASTGSYIPAFLVAVVVLLAFLPCYWLMVKTG